jgi:hypothetical protein
VIGVLSNSNDRAIIKRVGEVSGHRQDQPSGDYMLSIAYLFHYISSLSVLLYNIIYLLLPLFHISWPVEFKADFLFSCYITFKSK